MKFFKHFTDAHEGKSMMALMAKFGVEGYGAFFILTELCAKKLEKKADEEYSEGHLKFTFNERLVREKLRMRSTKVELFLNYCATLDLLLFTKEDDEFHFYFPKLLESMDRDSKRARTQRDISAPKNKNKEEEKELEKEIGITNVIPSPVAKQVRQRGPSSRETFSVFDVIDLVTHIDPKVGERWNKLYSPDYVQREFIKMVNYLVTNPAKNKKTKRGLSLFVGGWLDRGWSKHQAQTPGEKESGVKAWAREQGLEVG